MGKKQEVIAELYRICQAKNDYTFDNNLVKDVCRRFRFGNPFDATKIDNMAILPDVVRDEDHALIHIGSGRHQFIKGLSKVYHTFEPIETTINWTYRRSLLNGYNTSESNILSIANNQRILHHFLLGKDAEFDTIDIVARPKTYFPHRTKTDLRYFFGQDIAIEATQIQIEIDLTIEYNGIIGVFEAKNGQATTFSVYQLFHPFLYYHNAKQRPDIGEKIREIICVYVTHRVKAGSSELYFWSYTFTNPLDITSITLQKSACYKLIGQ